VEEGFIRFCAQGEVYLLDPSGIVSLFEKEQEGSFRFLPDRAGIGSTEGVPSPSGEGKQKEGTGID